MREYPEIGMIIGVCVIKKVSFVIVLVSGQKGSAVDIEVGCKQSKLLDTSLPLPPSLLPLFLLFNPFLFLLHCSSTERLVMPTTNQSTCHPRK
jgi:hypothetical protein